MLVQRVPVVLHAGEDELHVRLEGLLVPSAVLFGLLLDLEGGLALASTNLILAVAVANVTPRKATPPVSSVFA